MSENGKILLDSCHTLLILVLSILLIPLLLLLSITHTKGTYSPGTLLLTLLLSTTLPFCGPPAAWASRLACVSRKDTFTLSQRGFLRSKDSSRQQNSLTTAARGSGQQSCHSLGRCSNSNQQQHVSFFTAESAGCSVNVYPTILKTLLLSNKRLPLPLLCGSRTHTCCCCTETNSNTAPSRQRAAASLTRRFRPLKVSSSSRSDRRLSLEKNRAAPGSLKKPPTHVCCSSSRCTSTCSRWRRREIAHDHLSWQQASRRRFAASRRRNISFACRLLCSLSNGRLRDSVGHLGVFFIVAPASALPAALNVLNFSAWKENLLHASQRHSEGSDTQQQKRKRRPISCSSSQRCCGWLLKYSWTTPIAAVKLAAASFSWKPFPYYVGNDTKVHTHSTYAPHIVGSCCCWMPAAARSSSRFARTCAACFSGPNSSSSSRKLLAGERKAYGGPLLTGGVCFSSSPAPAGVAEREGYSSGEEDEHCVKERNSTVNQLEKDLQRRHCAVGLAIKTGDPAVAFNAFDKHLQYAVAAVRQWVLHHTGSYLLQLQQPRCSWKPESVIQTPVLQRRDLQHEWGKKQQQHCQQGQGNEDKKQEKKPGVQKQEDSEAQRQKDVLVQLRHQNERSCQRKAGGLRKLNDEKEAPFQGLWGNQTSREGDGDRRVLHMSALTLMKPFVKSASGVLNLCCKDESDESSRSIQYMIARQVLRRLQEFHLLYPLETSVGNAFLTVAAAAGDVEAVAATLLLMQQQGVRPQRKSYDALLRTLLRQGEGYRRLRQSELLRCMLNQRMPPTPEQLFALLLRDAARVRIQLDKEQEAVQTLKLLLHPQNPQQQLLQRQISPQKHLVPPVHTEHGEALIGEKDKDTDKGENAGLERSSPCYYTANPIFCRGDRSSLNRIISSQEKNDAESCTAAVAAAHAALIEEVKRSLHVLREFVIGIEDALLLLQEVVSEQLPLLSDTAASRFVAALQTLQFPPIAHISHVMIRHSGAEANSNEQEVLSKPMREKDISYTKDIPPPSKARLHGTATATVEGAKLSNRELFNLHREEIGDTQRYLKDALVVEACAEQKVCDSKAVPEEEMSFVSEARGDSEAKRAFKQAEGCDFLLRRNDLQKQQQQQLGQAAETLNVSLPLLQRSAVCAGCGTRLRRVCLTDNERRLLRLGVLKLSAMLHPRQLRALLAFERALSYSEQLGFPALSSVTRRHISACSPGACRRGLQQEPRRPFPPHEEQQTEQEECVSSIGAKSGEAQAAAVACQCLPAPSGITSVPSAAAAEKSGGNSRGGKGMSCTTDRTDEILSAVRKSTAGEWRTRDEGDLCGHWNILTNQVGSSLLPRYTVVLDAANIAYNSQNRQEGVFSYPQIERVRQELLGRGERPLIILPSAYYWGITKQRIKQADRKAWKTKHTFKGNAILEETTARAGYSSSSRSIPVYQRMRTRLAERSRRTINEACLPPEATRLWLCRQGRCPLCIGEIQVPNRCKKSNRCSSQTPPKLPVEPSCWAGGSAVDRHKEVDEPKDQTTTDSVRYATPSSSEGGQRLSCLDRALLRLWEQEKCLFVCRSGAHDDHYHLLASLSGCSPDSHTASSALLRLRGAGVSEGMETQEKPISTARQQAHAQPTRHREQQAYKFADLPISSLHPCAKECGLPDAEKRHQQQLPTAERTPYPAIGSGDMSHKGQQQGNRFSGASLMRIMLGMQADEHRSRIDHWNTEKQEQSNRRTCSPRDVDLLDTSQSLWQRLWRCGPSRDGIAPPASSGLLHSSENRVGIAVDTVADDRRERSRVNQSTTAFLGYSWDDFICKREVGNGAQQETATVSSEEVHYPVALLTNDRFRDHRLSSQQRIAFKHWRQLALLPYVFQRRLILSRSGFAEVSPAESGRQHTATSFRRSACRMYGGARHPHEHNSTDQQQDRSTAVRGEHILMAGGSSSAGDVLEKVDTEANHGRLVDGVGTVGLKTVRKGKKTAYQGMPGHNVSDKHEEAEGDDTEMPDCALRLPHDTELDFVELAGADAWDGRCGFKSTERQIGKWSLDDLDIAADRGVNEGGSSIQWNSRKSTFCGDAELYNRANREKNMFGRETRCGDYGGEEMEPLLFIGMLQPVTRRVQVSLRKNKNRGLRSGVKLSETPTVHALSLLDLSYTSTPHEDDAVIWHIPLRREEEEAFQKEDNLFATHSINVTVNHSGAHTLTRISEHIPKKQESFHDALRTASYDSLSAYRRVYIPNEEAHCIPQPTKTDTLSEQTIKKKKFTRDVFADFDMLSQHSREDVQGEEPLAESDVWLGIDLAPLSQILRAREQFLRYVE